MSKKPTPPATPAELRELEINASEGDNWVPRLRRTEQPLERTRTALAANKYWPVFLTLAKLGFLAKEVRLLRGRDLELGSDKPSISLYGEWHLGERLIQRKRIWFLDPAQADAFRWLSQRHQNAPLIPVGTESERVQDACRWMSFKCGLPRLLSYDQILAGYKSLTKGIGPKPVVLG